jgi:hypothetical protein
VVYSLQAFKNVVLIIYEYIPKKDDVMGPFRILINKELDRLIQLTCYFHGIKAINQGHATIMHPKFW